MRIRWRLAAYGATVAAVAMLSFGLLLTLLARSAAPADQDTTLTELAASARDNLTGIPAEMLASGEPLARTDLATSVDAFIAVFTEDGTPIYSTGEVADAAPRLPAAVIVEALDLGSSTATIVAAEGVELRVVAEAYQLDGEPAVVVAGQSTQFVEEQLAGLTAVVWIAAFIALVGAIIVSWLVSGRAMRPLRRLAETTDEIGHTGDLSRRLPPVKAKDEVGTLTRSFNDMLTKVETAQADLETALIRQRRFVADASHELRGPLTTIRSNAGFLLDRKDATDADRNEAIADIDAEADRMARLVDDLLILARADAEQSLHMVPVDMAAVVGELERRAGAIDGDVRFDLDAPAVVEGDADALRRMVWILIDNAGRHGDGSVAVTLRARPEVIRLEVTDQGAGFTYGELDRVFDRFYRADPARSPAGSGLGLAIAKEIAEAHGGSIAAANRPEGGAVLQVVLPAG